VVAEMIGPALDQEAREAFAAHDLAEGLDCPLCGSADLELVHGRDEGGPLTDAVCNDCGCTWETNL
jgi:hypothetical protein